MLTGAKTLRITVCQVFGLTYLLTAPERLRSEASRWVNSIRKGRRTRNRNQVLSVPGFGDLRPVSITDNQEFWRPAIEKSQDKTTAPPLQFIPFDLALTDRLKSRRPSLESVLDAPLGSSQRLVTDKQVSGRLRIYPLGIGVVRMTIALTFADGIHIQAAAHIARGIEQLLFVDAGANAGEPTGTLIRQAIDPVIRFLFEEKYQQKDLRWLPPEIIHRINNYQDSNLAEATGPLAYLVSAGEGNQEEEATIFHRIQAAAKSKTWSLDGVMAVASERTSLFVASAPERAGKSKQFEWLMEACELVWAALFAQQAAADEISQLADAAGEESDWSPSKASDVTYARALLDNTRNVLRATDSAQRHLLARGATVVWRFANELWRLNNSVKPDSVRGDLERLRQSLARSKEPAARELESMIDRVSPLVKLFGARE